MFLSKLSLWNFRKYGSSDFDINKPNLVVNFKKGMNVLVGENDSGKTAIMDAIKLVLKTHAYEWIRPDNTDFYTHTNRLRIELRFEGLKDDEAKHFTEWLCWEKCGDKSIPILRLIYQVDRKANKIAPSEVKGGMDDTGTMLSADAKAFLKTTYLKALRDAQSDLMARKNSRLSQILQEHELFKKKKPDDDHAFEKIVGQANSDIQRWFGTKENQIIRDSIDSFLEKFISPNHKSKFIIGDPEIRAILEKISLVIDDNFNLGLGSLNRLFMATELLHLKKSNYDGLRLCLIEELEAHLHPQAQLRIIKTLQDEAETHDDNQVQFILTTHSPNLASKVKLHNLIMCHGNDVFPLGEEPKVDDKKKKKKEDRFTKLRGEDYKYLERFLDVTKSNLFFAKGVIIVEGWSEEILIPALAEKIGIDLTSQEVSIVNVGSTAYLHFANIFSRNDGKKLDIPVSVVSDLDNRPDADGEFDEEEAKAKEESLKKIMESFEGSSIKLFKAPQWTLEWCLLKSPVLAEKFKETLREVHSGTPEFKTDDEFDSKFMSKLKKSKGHSGLDKVRIASVMSEKLFELDFTKEEIEGDEYIDYLIKSIEHASGIKSKIDNAK